MEHPSILIKSYSSQKCFFLLPFATKDMYWQIYLFSHTQWSYMVIIHKIIWYKIFKIKSCWYISYFNLPIPINLLRPGFQGLGEIHNSPFPCIGALQIRGEKAKMKPKCSAIFLPELKLLDFLSFELQVVRKWDTEHKI